jgi:hypothetical protein
VQVVAKCEGWETPLTNAEGPSRFSLMHLGTHILNDKPIAEDQVTVEVDASSEHEEHQEHHDGTRNSRASRSRRERDWEATARFNDLSQKLTNAHGLVMVLPWPLLHRARCGHICVNISLAKPHRDIHDVTVNARMLTFGWFALLCVYCKVLPRP